MTYQKNFLSLEDFKILLREEVGICELRPDEALENKLKKAILA